MSVRTYWKSVIEDTHDWSSQSFYVLDASSVNSLYFPRPTDIITLTPTSESIRCWSEWDGSGQRWKVYVSDPTFIGKIYYRLQARAY